MKSNRRLFIIFITSILIISGLGFVVKSERLNNYEDRAKKNDKNYSVDIKGIKDTTENFIREDFNNLCGKNESLYVDENSIVFKSFLKKKAEYREDLNLKSEFRERKVNKNYEFSFNDIKIDKDLAFLNVDVTNNRKFLDEKKNGSDGDSINRTSYDLVLHKRNNEWKVWAAESNDMIINPYDYKMNIIKLSGLPEDFENPEFSYMKKNKAIDFIERFVMHNSIYIENKMK